MAIRFKLEVLGEAQFDRTFDRLDLAVTDLSDTWDEIKDEFFAIEREQFKTEGSAGASGQWQKLSSNYEKVKNQKYPNKGILRRTDRMYKLLTSDSENLIYRKNKDEMSLNTNLEYPFYHQRGGKTLPKREPVSLSENQKKRIQKRIQLSLLEQIRKTGFEVKK